MQNVEMLLEDFKKVFISIYMTFS